jgi:hypothetical protein
MYGANFIGGNYGFLQASRLAQQKSNDEVFIRAFQVSHHE